MITSQEDPGAACLTGMRLALTLALMPGISFEPSPELVAELAPELVCKDAELNRLLQAAGRLIVAYSGGVDSAYLAFAANRNLGRDFLAVTALSASYPEVQRTMAERVSREFEFSHEYVSTPEMENPAYRANGPDRCYHCKSELFSVLSEFRDRRGYTAVAYGVNTDDTADFRPGHRAAAEQGVRSPYLEVGLSKQEIRQLSHKAGLPTADLPSSACLASRLPYGTAVTEGRLKQVEQGEDRLRELGFRQVRVRHHGELARIEVGHEELPKAFEMTGEIAAKIKPLGFRWVSLDLEGYRTGSLNEALAKNASARETERDS